MENKNQAWKFHRSKSTPDTEGTGKKPSGDPGTYPTVEPIKISLFSLKNFIIFSVEKSLKFPASFSNIWSTFVRISAKCCSTFHSLMILWNSVFDEFDIFFENFDFCYHLELRAKVLSRKMSHQTWTWGNNLTIVKLELRISWPNHRNRLIFGPKMPKNEHFL